MPSNIKALKARIRSVDSTMHITKAMELVASSKIKKASAKMEESRFYRQVMEEAFAELAKSESPYATRKDAPALYLAIAGDRGLAGGYNNNIFKTVRERIGPKDAVLPIGRRSLEYFRHHGQVIFSDAYPTSERLTPDDCAAIGQAVTRAFDEGKIGAVYLVYTEFVSMLTQEARCTQLLPLVPPVPPDKQEAETDGWPNGTATETTKSGSRSYAAETIYEPDPETVLAAVIPEYVAGVVYSASTMSFASELAARRQAMDTATKNAEEMIDALNLRYNRARQGAITQEITEIIAGSNQ